MYSRFIVSFDYSLCSKKKGLNTKYPEGNCFYLAFFFSHCKALVNQISNQYYLADEIDKSYDCPYCQFSSKRHMVIKQIAK